MKKEPYWEKETPSIVMTTVNELRYFTEAGKLQVSTLPWKDADGVEHRGKTVTLDTKAAMVSPDAAAMMASIFGAATGPAA